MPLNGDFFFKLVIFRAVLGLKQNCLKGIETSESARVLWHAEPPLLSASYSAMAHLLPPWTCMDYYTRVGLQPTADVRLSLGVGRVVGLEHCIMTKVHYTEQFHCPKSAFLSLFISPVPLKSDLFWIVCVWVFWGI